LSQAAALATKPTIEPLADGIYFDLDEYEYRRDGALGSSDHKKLLGNPCDYWYESPMNPNKPAERDTPAKERGKAMHALIFYGQEQFDATYMRGPDHTDDMTPAEKGALTKAANAQAAKSGKEVLPAEAYDRIIIASAMITKNPKLATAFSDGIPEVSIFWTRDGVRRKARLDYLKPRGVGDLKSITNSRELPFPAACRNAIANYHYEIQAALYLEARGMVPEFFKNGKVYLAPQSQNHYDVLAKCAETKLYAFQWVFFQADKAPITWSRILSPANPICEIARREIDEAAENYQSFMEHFGPDQMWLLLDQPEELDMSEMPGWWGRS